MEQVYAIAAVWLALAVLSTVRGQPFADLDGAGGDLRGHGRRAGGRQLVLTPMPWGRTWIGSASSPPWARCCLTFLAGAELDPAAMKAKLEEVVIVGLFGFFAPFLGCAAMARFVLGWGSSASWLAGHRAFDHVDGRRLRGDARIRLQQDRVRQRHSRRLLRQRPGHRDCPGADLRPVHLPDGRLRRRVGRAARAAAADHLAPDRPLRQPNRRHQDQVDPARALRLGALALWAGSEAVLPAYIAGMVLAKTVGRDHFYIRRLRTLTVGFLTPFYFLRAGSLVSLPALAAAPLVFLALFAGKSASKIFGLFPVIGRFRQDGKERWYYTLMMSTGLTFGTISALYGLTHGIVTQDQYSFLVATVIASAVIPTMIANAAFLPRHLLPGVPLADEEIPQLEAATSE